MKSTYATFLSLVSVVTLLSLLSGCTLIGAQMGSNASLEAETITAMQISDLQKGRKISVSMKDSLQYSGIYKGLQLEPLASYQDRYDTWFISMQEKRYGLPYPEETLSLTLKSGNVESGLFYGFDRDVIYIKARKRLKTISMNEVMQFTNRLEETCAGTVILELNEKGAAPLRTVIALYESDLSSPQTATQTSNQEEGYTRFIDPNKVVSIHIEGKSYMAAGRLTGLVVDAAIISLSIALISAW